MIPPQCAIEPPPPVTVGSPASLSVKLLTGTGPIGYVWDFGDGSAPTELSNTPSATHVYSSPGHFQVKTTVTNTVDRSTCAAQQTVHYELTDETPTSSSTIILANIPTNTRSGVGERIWTVNPDNNTVTAIDIQTLTKLFEQPVGSNPRTLAQAPDGTIWVINQDDASITILDQIDGQLLHTVSLPPASRPYGIVFSPDKSAAYVTLQATGRLVKLNPTTRTILATVDIGPTPRGLAVSADSKRIFISRFISPVNQGQILEVDGTGFRFAGILPLALDPGPDTESSGRGLPNALQSPTISPDGLRLWIPSKKDNIFRGFYRDGQGLTFDSTVRTIVSQIVLATHQEDQKARHDFENSDMAVAIQFAPLGN
ncbi:PKD domain-containing protein [Chloroflexi bacterium TSY]|nr:PKD domain-containing protein [Chloroflexi bacterium TSY]